MGGNKESIIGLRFDKRVVLELTVSSPRTPWLVVCDCGAKFDCLMQDLRRGGNCRNCYEKSPVRVNRRKRPYESVYNLFVGRAKHEVALTYEDYFNIAVSKPNCYYCDSTLKWSEFRDRKQSGSNLDRKDSNKGYTIDNVVPCCRVCNITKNNNFTHEEFILLGKVISQINAQRALALLQLELEEETKKGN